MLQIFLYARRPILSAEVGHHAELDPCMHDCMVKATLRVELVRLAKQRWKPGHPEPEEYFLMRRDEVTTQYGKIRPGARVVLGYSTAPQTNALCVSNDGTQFAQRRPQLYGRESQDVPALRRRGPHAAPVHTIGPHCFSARVPGLSLYGICGRQSRRLVVIGTVRRRLSIGTGRRQRSRRHMRTLLEALTAFFEEHQRCGELDGGRDNGYIWLGCSCGAQITHPVTAPSPTPAELPKLPIARLPD